MDISPLFCAVIRVKRNWLQICILDIYRIVTRPEGGDEMPEFDDEGNVKEKKKKKRKKKKEKEKEPGFMDTFYNGVDTMKNWITGDGSKDDL